jgi:hypothetical protein
MSYYLNLFNLKLLKSTLTLLRAIAKAAIIGLNKTQKNGKSIHAATGIHNTL